jgi:nitrite reductase/ring-hydroxylating ferredoxin subunit
MCKQYDLFPSRIRFFIRCVARTERRQNYPRDDDAACDLKINTMMGTVSTHAVMAKTVGRSSGHGGERRMASSVRTMMGRRHQEPWHRRGDDVVRRAGKRRGIGQILDDEFNENAEGGKKERKSKRVADGGAQFDASAAKMGGNEKWIKVGNVNELEEKPIKALLLANGNFCMVKYGTMVFITACNSTAYQYPLIDGELFEGPSGAAIRSPLDGTSYDLATGDVIEWCPQDNMMRKFLGGLKKAVTPIPLPVYPTKIDKDGDVFTYFI